MNIIARFYLRFIERRLARATFQVSGSWEMWNDWGGSFFRLKVGRKMRQWVEK